MDAGFEELDGARGMRPRSIPAKIEGDSLEHDYGELGVLVKELHKKDPKIDGWPLGLAESTFLNLDALVEAIHDHPLANNWPLRAFEDQGFLPCGYMDDKSLIMAVRYNKEDGSLETADNIHVRLGVGLEGYSEWIPDRISWVMLTYDEFESLFSLVPDAGERQRYLDRHQHRPDEDDPDAGKGFMLICEGAAAKKATDVHFEIIQGEPRIRLRREGALEPADQKVGIRFMQRMINAVQQMGKLPYAERGAKGCSVAFSQTPYIGEFPELEDYTVRISIIPTISGQKMVARIHSKKAQSFDISNLGLPLEVEKAVRRICRAPKGMFILTGPTGSGKTTTLYSCIETLDKGRKNITTIEDPVEYLLDGIIQTQVSRQDKWDFTTALRFLLRQDPDIMLVGELRDSETAQMAANAANTGHMVYSTLHANGAAEIIPRLQALGVDPWYIRSLLRGVLAQRLLRVLCQECKVRYEATDLINDMFRQRVLEHAVYFWRAKEGNDCDYCGGRGYKGRRPACELLVPTDPVRALMGRREISNKDIYRAAKKSRYNPMRTLGEDAMRMLLEGKTSFEEMTDVGVTVDEFREYSEWVVPLIKVFDQKL